MGSKGKCWVPADHLTVKPTLSFQLALLGLILKYAQHLRTMRDLGKACDMKEKIKQTLRYLEERRR